MDVIMIEMIYIYIYVEYTGDIVGFFLGIYGRYIELHSGWWFGTWLL